MSRHAHLAATVGGVPLSVSEIDAREERLRGTTIAARLPRPGTREGRQLRRWLTQLLVTERVVAAEAAALGVRVDNAPAEHEVLPDLSARLEIGSVAASALADPLARALFQRITAAVEVTDHDVADYHARNPLRFAAGHSDRPGWHARTVDAPSLEEVRAAVTEHLRAAARRRAFRVWLDARVATLVELGPGYEHPGDPRQPDNTHKH